MSPILQGLANGSVRGYGGYLPLGASTAFESIASTTLGSDTATVSFSSIPSTYQHLQIRYIARGTRVDTDVRVEMEVNADSSSVYTSHYLWGDGASAAAAGYTAQTYVDCRSMTGASQTADRFGVSIIDLHDYASTSKFKTFRGTSAWDANGSGQIFLWSALWRSTSAVSNLLIRPQTDSFKAGSTFALYGIKGA